MAHFNGDDFDRERDQERLTQQHERIAALMIDGEWRTVKAISQLVRAPENSVQAQLRHLRKPRFGGYIVTKERGENSLYCYRVRERTAEDPPYQGGGRSVKAMQDRVDRMVRLNQRVAKWMLNLGFVDEHDRLLALSSEISGDTSCADGATTVQQ